MNHIISKNPLFFAFMFPAVFDGIITVIGQDELYWTNQVVNEASPAYYALVVSPWLFVFAGVLWLIIWYWLFKKLHEPVNLFFMFLFISSHSWGSSTWLWNMMKSANIYSLGNQPTIMFAWCINILYCMLIALVAAYCLRTYLQKRN